MNAAPTPRLAPARNRRLKAMRDAANASRTALATRADLYPVAVGIVITNAAITFGLIKRL